MDEDAVSVAIARKVATLEGADPTEITPRLYDAIDPDALDSLFCGADGAANDEAPTVEFEYYGYSVTVEGPDDVRVTKAETESDVNLRNVDGSIGD